ncbi:MAG: hypothetical protein ACFFFK_03045 [Candidatus Thorarchaeota archaeon]
MIKKKVSVLALTIILCLMLPAIFPAPETNYARAMKDIFDNQDDFVISQEVAWSDDFDHGNISGWSVQGLNTSTFPWTLVPGNFTTEDNTMRADGEEWSEAWRTSDVAFGSWAFDVYCVDTPNGRCYIAFVSGSPVVYPPDPSTLPFEYGIITVVGQYQDYSSAFVLYCRYPSDLFCYSLGYYDVDEVSGWYHFNIIHYSNGDFNVYINDTLRITTKNSYHTTSNLFTFTAEAGYAIDNIVVSYLEDIPPDIANPIRTPTAPNSTDSVVVEVGVTDPSGIDTVILSYYNGTTLFNITMTGTEPLYQGTIPALPDGTEVYYQIYASDNAGNWGVSEIDSYTVIDPTSPPPPPPPLWGPIAIGGGVALAVIVLTIVFLKRR